VLRKGRGGEDKAGLYGMIDDFESISQRLQHEVALGRHKDKMVLQGLFRSYENTRGEGFSFKTY
jgi:hypothetical protein